MKKIFNLLTVISIIALGILSVSCTDNDITGSGTEEADGAPLNIFVGFGTQTRVAELPNPEAINEEGASGLQHIGLYVYYTSDYNDNDLSMPYIRNMECRIENGKLVPVLADGESTTNKNIYIYDYMTLVAFYPYNADMSLQENWFKVRTDEENYPITLSDYSLQTYIPYRGQVSVNPTTAYYIELTLYPKHTFRMEIILVSENEDDFNEQNLGDIKILPAIDPVDNDDPTTDGKREAGFDQRIALPNTGGGMHVRRYVAYIWQDEEMDHVIYQNEVLYENGDFTLLATEEIRPSEQRAYRYGYNFTTGESFIPTSSTLINDAASLQAFNGNNSAVYQVCDIDLAGVSFTPISMINSTYDGGGHKISNLSVNATGNEAGLFSQILGNSNLKNVNLINPVITMNSTVDTCFVGALCGHVNNKLTQEELENFYASINLPENLSDVVKQALINEMLAGLYNSQSQVIACRVENPVITVTGTHPRVGTICGANGDRSLDASDSYRGVIWDTYSLGGSLTVNAGNPAANAGAEVGGFCGLNQYFIGRSFATIEEADISAIREVEGTDENGNPVTEEENIFEGFTNQGSLFSAAEGAGVDNCFAVAPDSNAGVAQMPAAWPSGWVQYTGIWPINTITWTSYSGNSYWYSVGVAPTTYPTLQWERR